MEEIIKIIDSKINEAENCEEIDITEDYIQGYINGLNMAKIILNENEKILTLKTVEKILKEKM